MPTKCVRMVAGSRGARRGGKLATSVPSMSSTIESFPCQCGCCGGSSAFRRLSASLAALSGTGAAGADGGGTRGSTAAAVAELSTSLLSVRVVSVADDGGVARTSELVDALLVLAVETWSSFAIAARARVMLCLSTNCARF